MTARRAGRIILAILVGYLLNALLVAATELLLPKLVYGRNYFVADLVTQCAYEIAAGYLCCVIALGRDRQKSDQKIATLGLMILGLAVGGFSLAASWNAEPRWYGTALLCVWVPFIWFGYLLARSSAGPKPASV